MKRNAFIAAALEELQQEVEAGTNQNAIPVSTVAETSTTEAPAAAAAEAPAGVGEAPQPPVTEVTFDQSVDAVASLMEKNTELATENIELQGEQFDNDVDAIQTVSDSVNEDLEEAVAAGVALEELAHLAVLTAKSGMANKASVATLAFALEQITERVGMSGAVAALEEGAVAQYDASTAEGAKAQAEAVGKAAEEKSKSIIQRLIDGIKRIVGWIINVVRQMFTRFSGLTKRIQAAAAQLDSIDESKTIDSKPFIASLRLVEGGGDPNKQFEEYAKLSAKTLYGFFNDSFGIRLTGALKSDGGDDTGVNEELIQILRTMMSVIFTEHGNGNDVQAAIPESVQEKDLTVGKTVPCVGGVQLYLAATLDGASEWYCRTGLAKTQPKIDAPESVPVVTKKLADQMFGLITKWILEQKKLESIFRGLSSFKRDAEKVTSKNVSQYLSVLSSIATGVMPHFLRLNIQNSVNFVAYVEKSIAVSKAPNAEKK